MSYFSPECSARVFRKRGNYAELASNALWIVSFKCVVKGYLECRFDVKDGEVFKVLKKTGGKGRAFRIANERGQLGPGGGGGRGTAMYGLYRYVPL